MPQRRDRGVAAGPAVETAARVSRGGGEEEARNRRGRAAEAGVGPEDRLLVELRGTAVDRRPTTTAIRKHLRSQ